MEDMSESANRESKQGRCGADSVSRDQAEGTSQEGTSQEGAVIQGAENSLAPVGNPDQASGAKAELESAFPAEAGGIAESARLLHRSRRLWSDILQTGVALTIVGVGMLVWYKPILVSDTFPRVTYYHDGQRFDDATLYRPLAMPTRFYISLPRKLSGRYQWFTVDRRREIVALAAKPQKNLLGKLAIKRGDPLGLDLEFRKIDGSEWRVDFLERTIVFSNAVLVVKLDAERHSGR